MKVLFRDWSIVALLVGLCLNVVPHADAGTLSQEERIPHLDDEGQDGFEDYKSGEPYRAFAIAPGGAWAWVSGYANASDASAAALSECSLYTNETCQSYALDDQIVFDREAWAASWSPYLSEAAADSAKEGVKRGHRFPDLEFFAPDGRKLTLSDFKGRVVFLHFWGSWCPPCQAEFPELQKLYDSLREENGLDFVLVQSREAISKSRQWAKRQGVSIPLHDSGAKSRKDAEFRLADGATMDDRRVAPSFPSTYILDGNGIVVFGHTGPASDWPGYEPLLRHVMGSLKK